VWPAFEKVNFAVSAIICVCILGKVAVAILFRDTTGKICVQAENGRFTLSNTGWTLTLWVLVADTFSALSFKWYAVLWAGCSLVSLGGSINTRCHDCVLPRGQLSTSRTSTAQFCRCIGCGLVSCDIRKGTNASENAARYWPAGGLINYISYPSRLGCHSPLWMGRNTVWFANALLRFCPTCCVR